MTQPEKIGRYQVESLLGQGGMGAVYRAVDPVLQRSVAVKTLGGALLAPELRDEFLERFQREARAAGRLSHPSIVAVHDLGVDDATGLPFIVMEYVAGASLATVLKENPLLPVDQALDIVLQIGAALEEAHRSGIVHRDVKPANVFLDARGRVKVGDFGIARVEDSELTGTGLGLGTPGYMAPEVVRGQRADARSDLFSLGVLAYLLLAGKRPFAGSTREAIGFEVLQVEPKPPRELRPEVSESVSRAVMRALAKDPEDRPPGVAAFLAELRGEPARAGPPQLRAAGLTETRTTGTPAAPRRRRALLVALVALALAALAGLAFHWLRTAPGAAGPTPAPRPAATPRPAPPRPAPTLRPQPTPTPFVLPWPTPPVEERKKHGKGHGKPKKNR